MKPHIGDLPSTMSWEFENKEMKLLLGRETRK
jgi:hypothetical protein